MTVAEWFKKGRRLNFEIEELKEARNQAFNSACCGAVDYSTERVQTSKGNDAERKFANYTNLTVEIDKRITELSEHRRKMLGLINKIDDSIYNALLLGRYYNCKSWEEVAEGIGYSDKWTRTFLHDNALKEAEKYFEEK